MSSNQFNFTSLLVQQQEGQGIGAFSVTRPYTALKAQPWMRCLQMSLRTEGRTRLCWGTYFLSGQADV